jgi:hypothetical protein
LIREKFSVMAKVPDFALLTKVFEDSGVTCKAQDGGWRISQGDKTAVIEDNSVTAFEVERWASDQVRCRVIWDLTCRVIDQEAWDDLKAWQQQGIEGKPTELKTPPGEAYEMEEVFDFDPAERKDIICLPRKDDKGYYCFQVRMSRVGPPTAWITHLEDAGYKVEYDQDRKLFYGGLFPGAAEGLPYGVKLPEFKLRLDQNRPRRLSAASSAGASRGLSLKKPPVGEAGGRKKCPIPEFVSCQPLRKAWDQGRDHFSPLVANPPSKMKDLSTRADRTLAKASLKALKVFVGGWQENKGLERPTTGIFFKKLRTTAPTEELYCRLFVMVNSAFSIDWGSDKVMTMDEAVEARAAMTAVEDDDWDLSEDDE